MRMLREPAERIRQRCETIAAAIDNSVGSVAVVVVESVIGGGTAPKTRLKSYGLAFCPKSCDAASLLSNLRRSDPPIVARIEDDRVVLDLRTVEPHFDASLANLLNHSLRSRSRLDANRVDR
jgi:L-seryl-tRNA(Ser) seleniumtransferase